MSEHTQGKSRVRRFNPIVVLRTAVVVSTLLIGGLLLFRRASELTRRSICIVNLRGIGAAIHHYGDLHHAFPGPDTLGILIAGKFIEAKYSQCPHGAAYIVVHPTNENGADTDPRRLVLYEPLSNHREVVNALFADGHAESIRADAFQLPK